MPGISNVNLSLLTEIAGTGGDDNLRGQKAARHSSTNNPLK